FRRQKNTATASAESLCEQPETLWLRFRRRFRLCWLRRRFDLQAVTNQVPGRRRLRDLLFRPNDRQIYQPIRDDPRIRIHAAGVAVENRTHPRAFGVCSCNLRSYRGFLWTHSGLLDLSRKIADVLILKKFPGVRFLFGSLQPLSWRTHANHDTALGQLEQLHLSGALIAQLPIGWVVERQAVFGEVFGVLILCEGTAD